MNRLTRALWAAPLLVPFVLCGIASAAETSPPSLIGMDYAKAPAPGKTLEQDLQATLAADEFSLGLFPNSDGFLDGILVFRQSFSEYLGCALQADYSSRMAAESEEDLYDAKTVAKQILVNAEALRFTMPVRLSEQALLGFSLAASGMYLFDQQDTSGYKADQSLTTYFNTVVRTHHLGPAVKGGVSGALSKYVGIHLSGEYFPLLYITESGTKRYSTFDNPIGYDVLNYNSGYQVMASLRTKGIAIGDLELRGRYLHFAGDYQTEIVRVVGNYRYTIETYANHARTFMEAVLSYKMSYLKNVIDFVPVVSVAVARHQESFTEGAESTKNVVKVGLMGAF